MKFKIFLSAIFISSIFIPPSYPVEFETSTGEQDIVLMSTDGEVNLGDALSKSVEKQFKLVKDDSAQKRVDTIGQRIASVCDRKDIIYHFKIIDVRPRDKDETKPIINAFSLPGGYVYIFKDLYDKLNTDDEIAAVLAHETGHIVARHAVKRLQAAYGSAIFVILGSQARSPGTGRAVAAIDSLMLHNSREDELFADKLSVKYAKKAGFNPEGVVKVLQFLWETQKKEPIRPYVSEMTHPYLSVRLSEAKQEVNGKMDFNDYINIPTETNR